MSQSEKPKPVSSQRASMSILGLAYIPRWTIVPTLRHQSVAEHSWRVAVIAHELAARLRKAGWEGADPWGTLHAAVFHDQDEVGKGDAPSTTKPTPDFEAMNDVGLVVKVADYLEAMSWAEMWVHTSRRGQVMSHIYDRYHQAAAELAHRFQYAQGVIGGLMEDIKNE